MSELLPRRLMKNLFLLMTVLTAGCVNSASPVPTRLAPASNTETSAAAAAYVQCVDRAIVQLDDGKSDARTVATAVVNACRYQRSVFNEMLTRTSTPTTRMIFLEQDKATATDDAIQLILKRRTAMNFKP